MASILISGPAGAGKSQVAKQELERGDGLAILADFQRLYVALSGDERGSDGRYPLRDRRRLPLVEYLRRAAITTALARGIRVVATNSDGDQDRRAFLLQELGPDATERIVDPGEETVRRRLASPTTGRLSSACDRAIGRWYTRIPSDPR